MLSLAAFSASGENVKHDMIKIQEISYHFDSKVLLKPVENF
jgi:hypothetical protein